MQQSSGLVRRCWFFHLTASQTNTKGVADPKAFIAHHIPPITTQPATWVTCLMPKVSMIE
jgi:hypothetical protein